MRAVNNGGTEALLAAPFAFPAKLVVFLPATLIKKERPFFLEVFRHTGHSEHLLFTADLLPKRRNAQNLSELSFFWAILGVFFRYERLCFSGGILTANHSKAAVCHFRVTKKRRIATTLLSCSEDRAGERYSIICCTFSFC